MTTPLYPLNLVLQGRPVLLVGGGAVALHKAQALVQAGARLRVVAPSIALELVELAELVAAREFTGRDLDEVQLVVAAATPGVNRAVTQAAHARGLFVLAVDQPADGSAQSPAVLRRAGLTITISTDGAAPALAGLLREALEALLPDDGEAARWLDVARRARTAWRTDPRPHAAKRPLLLQALTALYEAPRMGAGGGESASSARREGAGESPPREERSARVFLVGAGPGDPDLLTVRALRVLERADVVLHDALVDARVIALAGRALCLSVGKRAGQPSMDQREIEAALVRAARAGRSVVRLKCGDPFVFGRGGEEALALAAAGIDFEIIPGVSSAIAGPGAAGIPVTHRGVARGFAVLTAQPTDGWHAAVDGLRPGALTLVFLMALRARPEIAQRLLERGWAPSTPAAIVLGAHTARQWSWSGRLADLATALIPADRADLPGLLVVGDVVAIAERITAPLAKETQLATA